ncbi:hypothetical protein CJF31_00010294 [Rutstroemia sp. NJR-2017a BVV2]|nr:hypothetical protein CJF31_00010294 [Rutstroemia sp. NJR-2017a BVV2]
MDSASSDASEPEQHVTDGHSCEECDHLMQQLLKPTIIHDASGRDYAKPINVGWMDSIMNVTYCSLCRLITRIYNQVRRLPTHLDERIYCEMGNGPVQVDASGYRCNWCISLFFFAPGPESEDCIDPLWTPSFRLLADDVFKLGVERGVKELGRLHQGFHVDHDFIRDCYETCIGNHGSACADPERPGSKGQKFPLVDPRPLPLAFRVIDVEDSMIIPAPDHCSFVVLSYVWGETRFPTLKKSNHRELQAHNSLTSWHVPKTIADAMEVSRILKIRYLWVDALCILQDDEDDKAAQIQQMDVIYSKANLTIVAAGEIAYADRGLWVASEQSKLFNQVVEEIWGLRFIGTAPLAQNVVSRSLWHKRAWTYQESVLSKRLLVFTDYQTYYSCEIAEFAQDYIQSVNADGSQQEAQCFSNVDSPKLSPLSYFSDEFRIIIRDYSARELSYDSDGLNAVSGVLRNYKRGTNDRFLCGLPISDLFEFGMLWFCRSSLRHRQPSRSGKPFPSWSWVGWVGGVDWVWHGKADDYTDSRIIFEWSFEHDGGTIRSEDLHYLTASVDQESQSMLTQFANLSLTTIETGILNFETKLASFHVEGTCWKGSVMFDDSDYAEKGFYRIMHGESWIGSVHLEALAISELSIHSGTMQSFVVLSESGGTILPMTVDRDAYGDEEPENTYYYSETLAVENEIDVYNVIMIIWEADVAYRRGIGQIHKKSFEGAEWIMKAIRLG